jgi:SNF2 family DNA or RNA helicase
MQALYSVPEQGQLAVVRQRRYVVTDVRRGTTAPHLTECPQHLVSLTSIEDDALGEELQVIWEIEPGARAFEKMELPEPEGFDQPAHLEAFLDAVRWGAASIADTRQLQSPFRSGIEIESYQLDPVVRAIQMPRVNLLIADDVGLGKTIESGMVVLELMLRHRANRVLVVCPSSLQIKWRDEMLEKFGLDFVIVDSALIKRLRRERGIYAYPWTHFPRLITSMDYVKREYPLRMFREAVAHEGARPGLRDFDILIVDEAHNAAPSGTGNFALDSQRTQALREIGKHFEHKLFLTATPHNGYKESFSALLELLDDQRFARSVAPEPAQLRAVMVRRLKSEIKNWDGTDKFPRRTLEHIPVDYTVEEQRIHEAALERNMELGVPIRGGRLPASVDYLIDTLMESGELRPL